MSGEDKKAEEQTTPLDLDAVIVNNLETFEGESEGETGEGAQAGGETEKETGPDQGSGETEEGETVKKEEEKKTEHPEDGEVSGKTETEKDEGSKASKKEYRFKDHDSAEKGYRSLQQKVTETNEENKKLKERVKAIEDAEALAEAEKKADQEIEDFALEQNKKALKAIDELDPEDENYQEEVAKIWSRKDREIGRFINRKGGEIGKAISPESEETGDKAAAGETDSSGDKNKDYVYEKAREANIDPEDDYFLYICSKTPAVDEKGQALDFDQQIGWAIESYKNYHAKHDRDYRNSQADAAKKKAEDHQEKNLPLGASPAEKTAEKEGKLKPVTMDDALKAVAEERRL